MRHIAYYISGNGYGHAVRSIEVIRTLTRKNPYLFFHIKTTAPRWFFTLNLESSYLYHELASDIGTVQDEFYEVNKAATLERARTFQQQQETILTAEKHFLEKNRVELVLGDIPPLAFEAASRAGIPSIAIGNFTWDWIYAAFAAKIPDFSEISDGIRAQYHKADLLLRLPMHGPMDCFPHIRDIPLIARKARRRPTDVRRMLGIEKDGRFLVLVALRPSDLRRVDFSRLSENRQMNFIVLNLQNLVAEFRNLPQNLMPFHELVNAADVVVSKPGYGIVAECLTNKTPLVYTERIDFPEYPILVKTLQQYGVNAFLPIDAFFSGDWGPVIESVVGKNWPEVELPCDGARHAAGEILSFIEGHRDESRTKEEPESSG